MTALPGSPAPRRRHTWVFVLSMTVPLLALLMYAVNPFDTASSDPRARLLGYSTFRTASTSMAPTLQTNDLVWVSTWGYRSEGPRVGDVVVFFPAHSPDVPWMSRVAGVGGNRVAIRDGVLHVDGVAITEPFIDADVLEEPVSREFPETVIPPGGLFLLGDNRDHSNDSRYWGPASEDAVIGRVTRIFASSDPARIGRVR